MLDGIDLNGPFGWYGSLEENLKEREKELKQSTDCYDQCRNNRGVYHLDAVSPK